MDSRGQIKLKLKAFISNKPITGTWIVKGSVSQKDEASCPFQSIVGTYWEERARNSMDTLLNQKILLQNIGYIIHVDVIHVRTKQNVKSIRNKKTITIQILN